MSANISVSMTGDAGVLDVFGRRAGNLGSDASLRGMSRAIGGAALFEVQVGFSKGVDPYGNAWAPKVFADGNKPLTGKSGKLRAGWRLVYAGTDAAIIGNGVSYARFQSGTGVFGPTGRPIVPKRGSVLSWKSAGKRFAFRSVRGAPPRLMVPRPGDLPVTWNRSITAAAREYMRARLAG